MNVMSKLVLQKKLGGLVLFKEGIFLRAYNESCYILTKQLGHKLAVQPKQLKCLDDNWIVMSAFPAGKLFERLPNSVITDFGAHLLGNFDLSGYHSWFKQVCRPANEVSRDKFFREKDALASVVRKNFCSLFHQLPDIDSLPVDLQQLHYLLNWQKGCYPIESDLSFIENLKQSLINQLNLNNQ